MPDYSIFTLGESQMTISGGGQLDGVTQGNGSHLVGLTITLNAPAWEEVRITDNDSDFEDNDGSQQLDGAQTIDGVSFPDNAVVEAEYSIVLSDGVNSWTAIGFNVQESSPSYATIEGLSFIGGPGGFPPIGVPLSVVSSAEGPSFASNSYATPICYGRGTPILTDRGPRPIEDLRIGDLIATADHGLQPIRWLGSRLVLGVGRFAPVEIAGGVLGATAPMRVSQQHRIAISSPMAELLFGASEVFVPAIHLVDGHDIRLQSGVAVDYYHLRLDRHEVIFASGVASESLYLGDVVAGGDTPESTFFGTMEPLTGRRPDLARPCLRRHEANLLLATIRDAEDGRHAETWLRRTANG